MASVCIVTNEVFPLDKGGIARLIYNFAIANGRASVPADIHLLLPAKLKGHEPALAAEYQTLATLHFCQEKLTRASALARAMETAPRNTSLDGHLITSFLYYEGLLDAQAALGRDFDFIEFPDFGGWGAVSIAAKRSGFAFHLTTIAVRLHSTVSLIVDHEPFYHTPSDWMAGICDLEHQSLRDADLVIAHLPSVADLNAKRFGAGWRDKVRVEFPPIVLSETELLAREECDTEHESDFLFTSRLQPFKRPDLFIRAAAHFLDSRPGSGNRFYVAAYGWDQDYCGWLKALVPARYREQIRFIEGLSPDERAELMMQCILVIPSDFESCCLLAYEGRLLELKLILNRRCIAFGSEPERWQEERDCLFFDGDYVSLAKAMERSLDWAPQPVPSCEPDLPYWSALPSPLPPLPSEAENLDVAVLLYGFTSVHDLDLRMQELALEDREIHVVVPRQAFQAVSASAAAWRAAGIAVHETSWPYPTPTDIDQAVRKIRAELVAFVPADVQVDRQLWTRAASAMGGAPEAAIYTTHAIVTADGTKRRHVLMYGDAPSVALMDDRVAHRASVFRVRALVELGIREVAQERWHEDLCARMVSAGHRVLVAPLALAELFEEPRVSRISAARYFGTVRDEAGALSGAPYRMGSVSAYSADSLLTIDTKAWAARVKDGEDRIAATGYRRGELFRFEHASLKGKYQDPQTGYRHLQIQLRALTVGRRIIDTFVFKLRRTAHDPAQLEFREAGGAAQFFTAWSPPESDRFGPVAVLHSCNSPAGQEQFFRDLPERDRQRLSTLVELLPRIVAGLGLEDEEASEWLVSAEHLVATLLAPEAPLEPERPQQELAN